MPRKNDGDDLDYDYEPEDETSTETEEEESDDPWSGLDDEIKQKAEAYAKHVTQQEINQFKGSYGKRFNQLKQDLQKAGLDTSENGNLVIGDPRRVAQFASTFIAPALNDTASQKTEEDDDDIPDMLLDPKGFKAWQRQQNQKDNAPIMEQLKQMQELLIQTRIPDTLTTAKSTLEAYGWEHLADDATFQQAYKVAISQAAPTEMHHPQVIENAAMMAVAYVRQQNGGKLPVPKVKAQEGGNVYRESLQQTGLNPGVGGVRTGGFSAEEIQGAKALSEMYGTEVTPAEYRALGEDREGNSYRKVVKERERKVRK